MSKGTHATQYAQAIVDAMLERWQGSLDQVGDALRQDSALAAKVNDASQDVVARADALAAALPGDIPAELVNVLKLVVQNGDLDQLAEISAALGRTVRGQAAPMQAEVTSATELSEADQAKIRTQLIQKHGDSLVIQFNVDPSLLGGLRVRIGDSLIDNSVASRLTALRESITSVVR